MARYKTQFLYLLLYRCICSYIHTVTKPLANTHGIVHMHIKYKYFKFVLIITNNWLFPSTYQPYPPVQHLSYSGWEFPIRSSSPSNHSTSICRQASLGLHGAPISMISILGPSKLSDIANSFHLWATPSMTLTLRPPRPFSNCSCESLGFWAAMLIIITLTF